jgi:alkylated DNA repair dioxygenase AlkB
VSQQFESVPLQPEGLRYVGNFVSAAMEEELISRIQALPLQSFQFGQFEGKRKVASFGYRYDYELRQLQKAEPIPSWLSDIVTRVEAFGGSDTRIRQILCTEYDAGVGIGWHRDKRHFDRIIRPVSRVRLQVPLSQSERRKMGSLHTRCRASLALHHVRSFTGSVGT